MREEHSTCKGGEERREDKIAGKRKLPLRVAREGCNASTQAAWAGAQSRNSDLLKPPLNSAVIKKIRFQTVRMGNYGSYTVIV